LEENQSLQAPKEYHAFFFCLLEFGGMTGKKTVNKLCAKSKGNGNGNGNEKQSKHRLYSSIHRNFIFPFDAHILSFVDVVATSQPTKLSVIQTALKL